MDSLFCSWCGRQLNERDSSCSSCGGSTETAYYVDRKKNNSLFRIVGNIREQYKNDILKNIHNFCDIRLLNKNQNSSFNVKPKDVFCQLKTRREAKTTELSRMFDGQITIIPENYNLKNEDIHTILLSLLNYFPKSSNGLSISNYCPDNFIMLTQKITAWNGGNKSIVIGTEKTFSKIIPENPNYRYNLDDNKTHFICNFLGSDCLLIPDVSDFKNPFGLMLPDNKLYFVSPTEGKLFKIVSEDENLENIGIAASCNQTVGILTI